jgi:hypothetical protein
MLSEQECGYNSSMVASSSAFGEEIFHSEWVLFTSNIDTEQHCSSDKAPTSIHEQKQV